ncbi:hypothetical protein P7K49_032453 [Saguinus oedipus]|uniref:Butyrophilin subfamily 3 member A2-like Ig-C domain-containing protein n=1 Tax=Saguinus oedipus TaxID=9490 RepID=A0ABQ9TY98_SAGOE|nr:hypothetical protein P7K49_032453 [Saguinus oedipus]
MSVNGYPRPRVYWINKTDNSLLDQALQNDTIVLNTRGLYDVVSVLRIAATASVNIGCCIENALLQQNLTVDSQTDSGARAGLGDLLRQKDSPFDGHSRTPKGGERERRREAHVMW